MKQLPSNARPVLHAITTELIVLLVWFDVDVVLCPSNIYDDAGDDQHPSDGHTRNNPHNGNWKKKNQTKIQVRIKRNVK